MGLDSPTIRMVIHWKPPNDVEEYVQETGRSGRDEERTIAVLYYGKSNGSSDMGQYAAEYKNEPNYLGENWLLHANLQQRPPILVEHQLDHQRSPSLPEHFLRRTSGS